MSTNYYAVLTDGTETDDPSDEDGLHIGKKSAGWQFLFRGYPERGLTTVASWLTLLNSPEWEIVDEYGRKRTVDELFRVVYSEEPRGERNYGDTGERLDLDSGVYFLDQEFC